MSRVASCTYVDIYLAPRAGRLKFRRLTGQTIFIITLSSAHVILFDLNCYDLLYENTGKSIKQWVWFNGCLICRRIAAN